MNAVSDYRFLMVREAIKRLERIVRSWNLSYPIHKGEALSLVREARKVIERIQYSFLPLNYLIKLKELERLSELTKRLGLMLLPQKGIALDHSTRFQVAQIKYSLLQLMGLRERLCLGSENKPHYSVDIIGVRVASVSKHPRAQKLYVTKAGTEKFGVTVVTNIATLRKGEVRAIAFLPPKDLIGVISEAMYCSGPIPEVWIEKRPPESLLYLKEIAHEVESIVKKHI